MDMNGYELEIRTYQVITSAARGEEPALLFDWYLPPRDV